MYNYDAIDYVELPKALSYSLTQELDSTCISIVHEQNLYNLTGKGTIVAIIDSGINFTHKDFINDDNTSRILYLWDQSIDSNSPKNFSIGTEYDNKKINEALNSDDPFNIIPQVDTLGHGTAVAGAAAGNGRASKGVEQGVAPEAALIVVKLKPQSDNSVLSTQIMRALKYVIDKAEALNMPIAINISYGTNNGSHDGGSLFETYLDSISSKWKSVIVIASGNEGAAGHHFSGKMQPNDVMDVTFNVASNIDNFYLTLWKNFVDTFSFQIIAPNGKSSSILDYTNRFSKFNTSGVTIYGGYGETNHYNQNQEIYFSFIKTGKYIPSGIWILRIRSYDVIDGRFNIWLPTVEEVTNKTAFTNPNNLFTITLPATAQKIIAVGGYDSKLIGLAPFSGRGKFDPYNIKPDLVAPAVNVLTTSLNGGYDTFSGTSIAAPFVSGAAALIMQWGIVNKNDPFLYGEKVKSFLKKGANRDVPAVFPNPSLGYGILCVRSTIDLLISYKTI